MLAKRGQPAGQQGDLFRFGLLVQVTGNRHARIQQFRTMRGAEDHIHELAILGAKGRDQCLLWRLAGGEKGSFHAGNGFGEIRPGQRPEDIFLVAVMQVKRGP